MNNSSLIDYQHFLNTQSTINNKESFLAFKINEDENNYLIRLDDVLKIGSINSDNISTLGICKDYFKGIINVNNTIATLIDLNKFFFPKSLFKQINKEFVLLKHDNHLAISCFKIKNILSVDLLTEMPILEKEIFIKKEYIHQENGIIYKEINVKEIEDFDDFKNVFNSF